MSELPNADSSYVKQLQAEIARSEAEKKAIVKEFENTVSGEWSAADLTDKIAKLLPTAYETIAGLLINADSESVRANLAKYVFDVAQRAASEDGSGSGVSKLLEELKGNDSTGAASPVELERTE